MSLQWVLDYAQQVSVNRRPIVSSTQTRSGYVRTVSRDLSFWTIEASLPEGMRWSLHRGNINDLEGQDRFTTEFIGFRNAGINYLYGYQGDNPTYTGWTATWLSGASIILTNGPTITSGFIFRKGDILQLGSAGHVYQVTADVPWDEVNVPLHRNVINASVGTYDLFIGRDARFKMKCVQFPQWQMIDYDQVGWSSPFVFQEVLD
jgi:hypothetical protein